MHLHYAIHFTNNHCCQPCGFTANSGFIFVELRFFLKTCGLLVFGLVLFEIYLFSGIWNWNLLVCFSQICLLRIAFFRIVWHFCCFNYCLRHIGRVFMKICLFWVCFLRICLPTVYLIFLLIFRFVELSCQSMLGLFYGLIHDFGLFFKSTCLFLQNNLASLQTMLGKAKR